MRFIIYGVGAIGGTLAVRLIEAGYNVVGIARGAQLGAIQTNGLTLRTPSGNLTHQFACVAHPSEIVFQADDIVLLTIKSQHTEAALVDLAGASVLDLPIVCMQNGVANEAMVLRYFGHVIGAMVNLPCIFLTPGEIVAACTPKAGIFDIGRFPNGHSKTVDIVCDALNASGFAAFPHDDVMRAKYGKLLLNLASGVDCALGPAARKGKYVGLLRAEALAVYQAANIQHDDILAPNPVRDGLMNDGVVPGVPNVGSSSAQSLKRGAGSTEIDYLNGHIAQMGRTHNVPTPANAMFTELARRLVADKAQPGSMDAAGVDAIYANWPHD